MKQESTTTQEKKLKKFRAIYNNESSNKTFDFESENIDKAEEFISKRFIIKDIRLIEIESEPPKKDFINQIADALLLRLKANTDDLSMSYELALKVDPGSINLKELRKILVCAGIREITIENATIKTIN